MQRARIRTSSVAHDVSLNVVSTDVTGAAQAVSEPVSRGTEAGGRRP